MSLFKNPKGFTIIELLVAVSIIGLLIAGALVFHNHTLKRGRDSERIRDIRAAWDIIFTNSLDADGYAHNANEVYQILNTKGYRVSSGLSDICYFVGIALGETNVATDDDFVFATWGETTSMKDKGRQGVIVMGTPQGVLNLSEARIIDGTATSLQPQDFFCRNPQGFEKVYRAFIGDPAFGP